MVKNMDSRSKPNVGRLRLKWKVFFYLFGFCALLLAILWLLQTVFLNDMYKYIRTQELSRVIDSVEKEIDNPDLLLILLNIQAENDIMISLTQDFFAPMWPGQQTTLRVDLQPPMRRGPVQYETITVTREFTLQNGQTISLTFHALIAPVNATVTTLRAQLYIVTGIMIILSIFLAVIISKRVSKPIEDISRSAKRLAKGDYDTKFSGEGFHEIVELSDTLNTAAVELGRVEGLRRELLANVSHDLRTPLSLIYSFAEMMNDFPDEITQEQTRVIVDETRRLTSLVNDVLDVSKLENEMERAEVSRFNITKNILETTERVGELVKSDGFAIRFRYDGEVYVEADEMKISRAFYNLLINAINYSDESREVEVAQEVSGGSVRISVTDSGEGVAEEDLPLIWERYYKSGKNHKRAAHGSGLGLSIVKKIIDLHGGSYGVESELGKGSTFWFEIPGQTPY